MRIAVDISPIDKNSKSAHKVRGVGKYISLLQNNIEKFDKQNSYIFTSTPKNLKSKIDLIHYPYFDPFFVALPFKKRYPTVVTVHDLIPIIHRKHFPVGIRGEIKWRVNKTLLIKSDAIITDSIASKQAVINVTGFDKAKVHPVYLAADECFTPQKISKEQKYVFFKKYNLPEKFILYVGDVTWNKNLPNLIRAIKKSNTSLVMVGKALAESGYDISHPWNKELVIVNKETADNRLFTKLGFLPIDDLVTLYNTAIALIMPSFDEGFGLPVLEAMQSGCPVITTQLGSLPEVGGDAVVYADAYSIVDMADKIIKVANDENLREALSKKSVEHAKNFTLKKMIEQTVDIYKSTYHETKN